VEAACRVSKAISVAPAKARPEWVQTGVCAGVGAALAVARLLKLDDRRTASAIGIAAARASGPRGLSRSMCFSYMAGSAAEAGLLGATSAGCGMTGPEEPLAGPQGFCACFSDNPHVGHLVADLGQRFELDANTFKPYPCGVVIHPVIEACLALAPRVRDSGEIEAIQIEVPPATARLADLLDPRDQYELQTSLQHWAACALGEGAAGVEQSQDDRLADPALTRLRRCVRILSDEALRRSAARVAVRLRSGREESARIEACQGSAENPMTDEDIERKYLAQAAPRLGEEAAHALAEACWRIDSLPSASRLMDLASGR
jgi:2-methylcitrate dehydratase PrpD